VFQFALTLKEGFAKSLGRAIGDYLPMSEDRGGHAGAGVVLLWAEFDGAIDGGFQGESANELVQWERCFWSGGLAIDQKLQKVDGPAGQVGRFPGQTVVVSPLHHVQRLEHLGEEWSNEDESGVVNVDCPQFRLFFLCI